MLCRINLFSGVEFKTSHIPAASPSGTHPTTDRHCGLQWHSPHYTDGLYLLSTVVRTNPRIVVVIVMLSYHALYRYLSPGLPSLNPASTPCSRFLFSQSYTTLSCQFHYRV